MWKDYEKNDWIEDNIYDSYEFVILVIDSLIERFTFHGKCEKINYIILFGKWA